MLFNKTNNTKKIEEKNKALYFPYINVPNNEWFTKVLLYWDEIGAIVPQDYIYNPERLDSHMTEFVHAGLVKQIIPNMDNMEAGRNFAQSFINLVEKYDINKKAKESRFGPNYTSKIHIDKFGSEISRYLVEEKLAMVDKYPWYRVESTTAGLFMSYLASFIGNSEEVKMQPITDKVATFETFSEEYAIGGFRQNYLLDRMRIEVLEEILPVPSYVYNVNSIVRFKEKYGDLLPKFRNKIEYKIREISFIENQEESEFQLNQYKQSLEEEVEEIVAKLSHRSWGKITFGTVCTLGAATIPGVKAVIDNEWSTGIASIPGVIGAVYSAYEGFQSKQMNIISSPFAYAAFVKRNLS